MSRVLRELLHFADQLEAGTPRDPSVDPEVERFAVRVPACAAVDLKVLAHGSVVTKVHARGDVVATDRRLRVVDGDEVLRDWAWERDVTEVVLLQDGLGIGLLPSPELHAAGTRTLFGAVTERMLEHPLPPDHETVPLALRWFMVEAAFYASRDDLDGWREHLRGLPW